MSTASNYFPSLDQCLAGEARIISWRTAYRALCDPHSAIDNSHLEQFFQNSDTLNTLSNTLAPHPKPDAQSASEFGTKTAPINISQTQDGHYNLEEIKADAKWLSRELDIDELSALRIAILEWQERPQDQLLITAYNGVDFVPTATGPSSVMLATSTTDLSASTTSSLRPALDFAKEDVRRQRLQEVYLSEKIHLLRLNADLVSRAAISRGNIQGHQTIAFKPSITQSWIDEVAAKVANAMDLHHDEPTKHELFTKKCISQLETALSRTESNTGWPKTFVDDSKCSAYIDALFCEIVQILRLLIASLYALDGIATASTVLSWFKLMDKYDFLQHAPPALANTDISVPQLLISIASVEVLKLQLAVGEIMNAAGAEIQSLRGSHYINDEDCLYNLNLTLYRAGQSSNSIAAPALLAWSVIVSVIRDISLIHRDIRDAREFGSDDTVDGIGRRSSVRRASVEPQSEFEKLYFKLCSRELEENRDDPARFFLTKSVDKLRVFNIISTLSTVVSTTYGLDAEAGSCFMCKETLLDLTRDGLPFVQYDTEILDAVLSFVSPLPNNYISQRQAAILADKLLTDEDQLRPAILGEALARFPYELSPLLRLCTALANAESRHRRPEGTPEIAEILHRLKHFTVEVPLDFREYQLENEEDNTNAMILTESLPVLARQLPLRGRESRLQLTGSEEDAFGPATFDIPSGTPGTIVKEQRPMVMMLDHEYSGLEYLAALLFTFTAGSELSAVASRSSLDKSGAAEVVSLFTALLSASLTQQNGAELAQDLLERLSKALGENHDIVSIVADILEAELLCHLDQQVTEGSLELVTAGAEFLNVLVRISPERVWSILAKSSLLGLERGAMSLVSVVSGTEVQNGQYRFLAACAEMYSLLLDDAIAGVVRRAARPDRKTARFAISQDSPDATPARTMSAVLSAYQKVLLDALHSLTDWKWKVPEEHLSITTRILDSFSLLLRSTYGIDVAKEAPKRLTHVLAPAADLLLSVCVPKAGSTPLVKTFERILPGGSILALDGTPATARTLLVKQVKSLVDFVTVLLRIPRLEATSPIALQNDAALSNGNREGSKRAFAFAAALVKSMPALASLLASDHTFKHCTYALLTELVKSLGATDKDVPSMLAQLNADAAQAFLQLTMHLDRPLLDVQTERCIWDFLAAIMASKQQWFAIYLLTGKLPKTRAHRHGEDTIKGKPVLAYALDQLSFISRMPPERAVGMLKFVAVAQQTWVWATNELRLHPDFLKNTLTWLETLHAPSRNALPGASIISARECEISGYLCEIYAINLHTSLEIGDKTVLKAIVPKLAYLRDHGTTVDAYNRSLHQRLESNLKATFPSSELSDFKRTSVNPAPYGTEYCYDRGLASTMLRHSESWHGRRADHGFYEEFSRANVNLSLLHAQASLLKSWKTLATTLCEFADEDASLQVELAKVAEQCLLANANPQVDEPGVADVLQLRVELAFVLISKLVVLRLDDSVMKKLLPAAWELVVTSPVDYDVVSAAEDIRYYRQLLQILYLAVQPHNYLTKVNTEMQYLSPQVASCFVSIVEKVIGRGFRALCGNIHSNVELALPADFALLTALLQAILAVPGISSVQTLLADVVARSSIIRGALSLYSWADQLADDTTQDPVYGEIAVMFLLALSTVRPIAEQMAIEGVLTQLSSGNLSNYLRKPGGKGPFDQPSRMFVIWTEGMLPLCLNLLDSVGPAIAADVALFLNSFTQQLSRAETSLVNETPSPRNPRAGAVTLSLVSEAHSLSMIALILKSDMAIGAAEGINPADIPTLNFNEEDVKTLVEALSRSKRSLQDRIRPATPLEERWAKTPVKGANDSLLQGKIHKEMLSTLACFGNLESATS